MNSSERILQHLVVKKNAAIEGNLGVGGAINVRTLNIDGHLTISNETILEGFQHRDVAWKHIDCDSLFVAKELRTGTLQTDVLLVDDTKMRHITAETIDTTKGTFMGVSCQTGQFAIANIDDLTNKNAICMNLSSNDIKTNTFSTIEATFSNTITLGSCILQAQTDKKVIVPKLPADAEFVMTQSDQSIHGTKTFNDPIVCLHSLILQSDGTPSALRHYERINMQIQFESEAFVSMPVTTVFLVRIGDMVTCVIGGFFTVGTSKWGTITSKQWIPRRFRPADTESHPVFFRDENRIQIGQLLVQSNGVISYGNLYSLTTSGTGDQGIQRTSLSWIVAS